MRTTFSDSTFGEDVDGVTVDDCGQAMGDCESCAAFGLLRREGVSEGVGEEAKETHKFSKTSLYLPLVVCVQTRGRFIEQKDCERVPVSEQRSREISRPNALGGSLRRTRAIATRCFSPPLRR